MAATLLGYLAAQSLRPVSAIPATSHFPSVRTMLNKSVPQWSTLPSTPGRRIGQRNDEEGRDQRARLPHGRILLPHLQEAAVAHRLWMLLDRRRGVQQENGLRSEMCPVALRAGGYAKSRTTPVLF